MKTDKKRKEVTRIPTTEPKDPRVCIDLDPTQEKRLADSLDILTGLGKSLLKDSTLLILPRCSAGQRDNR